MTLTKQQSKILDLMLELNRTTTQNELQQIYNTKYKDEDISVGIYNQVSRLVEAGYIKRVKEGKYEVTNMAKQLLNPDKEEVIPITFTQGEVDQIKAWSKEPNILAKLCENLNPGLLGLEVEKLAVLISLLSLNDAFGDKQRVHVILHGEPSSGKTSLLQWAHDNLWGLWAEAADAGGTSFSGSARGYQVEGGLLTMADKGSLFVNELDKLDVSYQKHFLSSMSEGRVTIDKSSVKTTLPAEARILANCNAYDKLNAELKSRFDITVTMKRLTRDDEKRIIRKKANDWGREKAVMTQDLFKRYLEYARQFVPTLPEDRSFLAEYMIQERETGALMKEDMRGIESPIRIMLALSRLQLKPFPDQNDLKLALLLIDNNEKRDEIVKFINLHEEK